MIVFSARSDATALAALVAQAGPGPARYRRALGVALSLADEAVAEPMARNMVRTLLRMPGMAERVRERLSQTPPAEVRISSQDASAAVEAVCLHRQPARADGLTPLQEQLRAAEQRLACADMIDDWKRRERELAYAQYAVEGLRRMVENEAASPAQPAPAQEKKWLTAREIAAKALPGVPRSERGVQLMAKRRCWNNRTGFVRARAGRGGGREYHINLIRELLATVGAA